MAIKRIGFAWVFTGVLVLLIPFLLPTFSARGQALPPGIKLHPLNPQNAAALPAGIAGPTNGVADTNLTQLAQWLRQHLTKSSNGTNAANVGTTSQSKVIAGSTSQAGGTGEEIRFRANGTPSVIKILASKSLARPAATIKPDETTRDGKVHDFFRSHRSQMHITDTDAEFEIRHREEDRMGKFHYRLQQRYHGIKVWGGEASVHLAADGSIDSMEGAFIPTPTNIPTNAIVSLTNAVEIVNQKYFSGRGNVFGKSELVINGAVKEQPRLAWKFSMSSDLVDARRFLVDAINGEVISVVSLVQDGAVTGSGTDTLGYTRSLNLWQSGSIYYMVDTSKAMYAATSAPPALASTKGGITVFDALNQPPNSNPTIVPSLYYAASSSATSGWVPDCVSAAYGLSKVYDFYNATYTRNSYDNKGSSLVGVVRYGVNFVNAFWNPQYQAMFFGDGMGRSVDVCGHEVTHGVINSIGDTGILEYKNQPGALNEALADIFGEMVEARTKGTNDWLIGSDLDSPFRSMANPNTYGQPSKMSEFGYTTSDNGGVHNNSGIINHAFYLLAAGLPNSVGIGDAQRIFYRAMTLHLLWQSQFIDMRHACVTSAEELFGIGSAQALKTAEAFDAVEIFDSPATAPPGSIPAVQAPDSTMCLRWLSGYGYYLVRKETAQGDPSTGSFVGTVNYLASKRVSVSGDGSDAAFITSDNYLGEVGTDGTGATVYDTAGNFHSVAIAPDASRVALVLLDKFTGEPKNQITIINLNTAGTQTFTLYGVTSEGNYMDVVDYADVMDFTADGRYLIYDAYCYSVTVSGDVLDGWTIFALDTTTGVIQTLVDLNTDYDIGNPALGNTHGNLIALDVMNKATGYSTVIAGNLTAGTSGVIGTTYGMGVPSYSGDDSAIVYSLYDTTVNSSFSLARRGIAADGITPTGAATWWLRDADYSVIYRRGTFFPSNTSPQANLTFPSVGQVFASPTNIVIQASAADADGTVSMVEFYVDSVKIGTDASAPYTMTWANAPVGSHRLTVRAIDNLGSAGDSANVLVYVLTPPKLTAQPQSKAAQAGSSTTFSATATGTAPLFYQWWKDGAALLGATNVSYFIPSVQTNDAGFYSLTVSNAAKTVSSTNAVLTVYVLPFITVQPTNQTVWAGSNATFNLTAAGVPTVKYQWRKNGANITGATNANFTTNNVTTLAAGTYSCLVSNTFGNATSSNAVLTVLVPDTSKPTNLITAPIAGQRWSNDLFVVTGKAGDNMQMSNVWCQINGLGWNLATTGNNWSNWTMQTSLTPGTNTIAAYSVDTSGNVSSTNVVKLVYVVSAPLGLNVVGKGTVSGAFNGQLLELGKSVTLTTTAATGYALTNWLVTVDGLPVISTNRVVPFIMQSNLSLTATFMDLQKPVLTITAPTLNQRWSNALFTVAGKVTDNGPLAMVNYQLNGGDWTNAQTANSWSNWTASVTLTPGTNTVRMYALDAAGNRSVTNTQKMVYVLTAPLGLNVVGKGTISPNYNNMALEIGKGYKMAAKATKGFAFRNWTVSTNWIGGVITSNATVQFLMASNLTFQVTFADVSKPILKIAKLASKQTVSTVTVKGTASDNVQVTNVFIQLNSGGWTNAVTTNQWANWSADFNLVPGANKVFAYAVDASGNYSTTATLSLQYTAPLASVVSPHFSIGITNAVSITEWAYSTDGFSLTLQTSPNQNGHIQVSPDLVNWATLTNFNGTNTLLNFRDPAATNTSQRFYRVVIP